MSGLAPVLRDAMERERVLTVLAGGRVYVCSACGADRAVCASLVNITNTVRVLSGRPPTFPFSLPDVWLPNGLPAVARSILVRPADDGRWADRCCRRGVDW